MTRRNLIAKAVRRIGPQLMPDKRRELADQASRRELAEAINWPIFRVQRKICGTCIFRPERPLDLAKLEDEVCDPYGCIEDHRICHHSEDVCCRGFWPRHKDESAADRIVQRHKCVGKPAMIKINGTTTVDDRFPENPDEGIIAWQLRGDYPDMEVNFRKLPFRDLSR
jgi:hypothetical protein